MSDQIRVKIRRFDPQVDKEPYYAEYQLPLAEGTSVLGVLKYIYENLDRSLSYYCSCRIGKCFGCWVTVNGKTQLACTTLAQGDMVIEPQKGYEVIKDLVVDRNKVIGRSEAADTAAS